MRPVRRVGEFQASRQRKKARPDCHREQSGRAFDHVCVVSTSITRFAPNCSSANVAIDPARTVSLSIDLAVEKRIVAEQASQAFVTSAGTRPAVPGGYPSLSGPDCGTHDSSLRNRERSYFMMAAQ